jgi:hypothetical protein
MRSAWRPGSCSAASVSSTHAVPRLVQRGLELNFAETDRDMRDALYAIVEQEVTASVSMGKVEREDLRKFFEAHREDFAFDGKPQTFDEARSELEFLCSNSELVHHAQHGLSARR